jgi:photosynthetic reaction center cytochrome c subunit
MKVGMRRTVRCAMETMIACLLCISSAHGQTPQAGTAQKPLMAEDAFKNVQVLRGIPVKEFMDAMGFFAASLGMNCTDCHVKESASNWGKYAADTPLKDTARRMVVMVNAINQADFGGERRVTCFTCHAGNQSPEVVPSLTLQYGPPPPEDPDEIQQLPNPPQTPSADQILDKYLQALGGSQQLSKLTSFSAKGTYEGFDTDFQKVPVEIYAQAPDQRAMVVHLAYGDSTATYDGREGWAAAPKEVAPVPVLPLLGGDLEGAKVDAQLSFPGQIKQDFTHWQAGFPTITVDNHPTQVVEGTTSGGARIKLFFDQQSGLLVRQARYTNTPVGRTPTHIEYSDYRTVNGVQMPFHWTVTWVDGQSTIQLSEVQPNVPVDASKFAKPAPPVQKPTPQ